MLHVGLGVETLQEDRARDTVRRHVCGLHLRHNVPDMGEVWRLTLGDRCINELVEGHFVRLKALLLHLFDERASLDKVPQLEVGLDQGIEGHHVDHARPPRLDHEVLGRLQVLALDASVEQCIVDEVVQLGTTRLCSFENCPRTFEVLLRRALANHGDELR